MYRFYHHGGAVLGRHLNRLPLPLPKPFWLMVVDPTPEDDEWLSFHGLNQTNAPPEDRRTLSLPWVEGHLRFLLDWESLVAVTPASFLPESGEGWDQSPASTLDRLLQKALADLSPQVARLGEEEKELAAHLAGSTRVFGAGNLFRLRRQAARLHSLFAEWERQLSAARIPVPARFEQLRQDAAGCREALREMSDWHLSLTLSGVHNNTRKVAVLTALTLPPTFLATVAATNLSWLNAHLTTAAAFLITLGIFVLAATVSFLYVLEWPGCHRE